MSCRTSEIPSTEAPSTQKVFIENDIVFNENATFVLRLHVVFVLLSYRFQPSERKRFKNAKTQGNLLFACQDDLNNLCLLLHRFQNFAFSVKTIRHATTISLRFQIFPLWRPFSKVCVFSENDNRVDARCKR